MTSYTLSEIFATVAQQGWPALNLHRDKQRPPRIPHRPSAADALFGHSRGLGPQPDFDLADPLRELPPEIGQLTELRVLRLGGHRLTRLPPEIGRLTRLTVLDLPDNELEELPAELGYLSHLEHLNLSRNRLGSLPTQLGNLTRLERLDLGSNQLTGLPPALVNLKALRRLDLSSNRLTQFPEILAHLKGLTWLDLANNQLEELSPLIGHLTQLRKLFLFRNRLRELPPQLGLLTELEHLSLFRNRLISLPPQVQLLQRLDLLDLRDNALQRLPMELGQNSNLAWLDVEGNPDLRQPPPEIQRQGTRAMLAYLRGQRERPTPQWLAKVLVVGEPGVGKTSVIRCLRGEEFEALSQPTHGIEINTLRLPHPTQAGVALQLRTWDFGGQHIYHAIHQVFLTNRSLFLLVWNAREGRELGRVTSWLELIRVRAPESVVLLVVTHIDQWKTIPAIAGLQKKYPQILGQVAIDCATGEGRANLQQEVARAAARLPRVGEPWPAHWVQAAAELRARPEQFLSTEQCLRLLASARLPEDEAEVLLHWLHDLGDVLHYRDDPACKDVVLLRPQWVAQVIGRVLENEEVQGQRGVLDAALRARLWGDIDRTLWEPLLRLMERFDLAYRVPDGDGAYLIVDQLPEEPPSYESAWEKALNIPGREQITLRYRLATVPAGIPTRFIARAQRYGTGLQWQNGMLLADETRQLWGLLRLDLEQRQVELSVRGRTPQHFFGVLRDIFESTLERFPGLTVQRFLPCPCSGPEVCPHEFDLTALERALLSGEGQVRLQCGQSFKHIYVPGLLFGLHPQTQDQVHGRLEMLLEKRQAQELTPGKTSASLLGQITNLAALVQRSFTDRLRQQQVLLDASCPNIFLLRTPQSSWQQALTAEQVELYLCCQEPGCWHPLPRSAGGFSPAGGYYQLTRAAHWFSSLWPYLEEMSRHLRYTVPAAGPHLADDELIQRWRADLVGMEQFLVALRNLEPSAAGELTSLEEGEGLQMQLLRRLLEQLDPRRAWGGLTRVTTPEGSVLWLCPNHASSYRR